MTITIRARVVGCAIVLAALCTAPTSIAAPVTYQLISGSDYSKGCFRPCLCPPGPLFSLEGTFRLEAVSLTGTYDEYIVTDISWATPSANVSIAGEGTYTTFNEVAALQQMKLDLSTNSEPAEQFDSDVVLVDQPFPAIGVVVSINGIFCFDTVITVQAEPVIGDINGDAAVDVDDLLEVIEGWGDCPATGESCDADIEPPFIGNGVVNIDDLLLVLSNW